MICTLYIVQPTSKCTVIHHTSLSCSIVSECCLFLYLSALCWMGSLNDWWPPSMEYILHCPDIVRSTFYMRLTLSRPYPYIWSPLPLRAHATMGRVLSNMQRRVSWMCFLNTALLHSSSKVCLRSKHESLAGVCVQPGGQTSNIQGVLLGNAQNIHTLPPR